MAILQVFWPIMAVSKTSTAQRHEETPCLSRVGSYLEMESDGPASWDSTRDARLNSNKLLATNRKYTIWMCTYRCTLVCVCILYIYVCNYIYIYKNVLKLCALFPDSSPKIEMTDCPVGTRKNCLCQLITTVSHWCGQQKLATFTP